MNYSNIFFSIIMLFGAFSCTTSSFSQTEKFESEWSKKIDQKVEEILANGNIPGLSLVIIRENQQYVKSYGYSDVERRTSVTLKTSFELGSCSKAFTSLSVIDLVNKGRIKLESNVSDYIPWFSVRYKNKKRKITIRQLLHHTSGVAWNTISLIPESSNENALEHTVRKIINQDLSSPPGKKYEYATANYDVLGLVIEYATNQKFEDYVHSNILQPLGLYNTTIGNAKIKSKMSHGYKIGFFKPRRYEPPIFKGNNPAGYFISNIEDVTKWLKFQMGITKHANYYKMAMITHKRDKTVPLHNMSSYAMGWEVSLDGTGQISHEGLNPNFSTFIAFRKEEKIGIAVLANSNSSNTAILGHEIIKVIAGDEPKIKTDPVDYYDKAFSIIAIFVTTLILFISTFLGYIFWGILTGRRRYKAITIEKVKNLVRVVVFILPFLYALYLIPAALVGFTWKSILVWMPLSFEYCMKLMLIGVCICYLTYILSVFYPNQNAYKKLIPQILLISILSGLSNVILVIMVTSAIDSDIQLQYLIFYYLLILSLYLFGRRFVQVKLINFSRKLIYDLKVKLITKIFSTSYEKFENIERGSVYTSLSDDVEIIGRSSNTIVSLITSLVTVLGAFIYLGTIAFWATLITISLMISLSLIYYYSIRKTNKYFEEARDEKDVYMSLLNGMLDGFKEISLHWNKRTEYKAEIANTANEYRKKITVADTRLVNAFIVGESLLVLLLGIVAFGIKEIFPNVESYTIMSFVIVLLYLIGPINMILESIPDLLYLRVAWYRLQGFIKKIPANLDLNVKSIIKERQISSFKTRGVKFQYKNKLGKNVFEIGPINLEVKSGEILFIIGGNGSGKSTLAKLLVGLYKADFGEILINDEPITHANLGEYFSTVFNPAYLFDKLYDINTDTKSEELSEHLKILELNKKVEIIRNKYSTIDLSSGERKRLALLQCFMEDAPIYLFDEFAADQDPDFRKFFYTVLLPRMRKEGKIVIAITHDDYYFDVADKIVKMNYGHMIKLEKKLTT